MGLNKRRWIRWAAGGVLALFLLALLADLILLPLIVKSKFDATLKELDAGDVSFHLDHASLWGSQFSAIRVGQIEVPLLSARYRPLTVIGGHLDSIEAVGARIQIDPGTESIFSKSKSKTSEKSGSSAGKTLPFKRVLLSSCILVVGTAEHQVEIPFDGELNPSPNGGSRIVFTANVFNRSLRVEGTMDPTRGVANLTGDADGLEVASILAALPQSGVLKSVNAGGRIALHGEYQLSEKGQSFSASAKLSDGWMAARAAGRVLVARPVALQIETLLDKDWHPAKFEATLDSPSVSIDRNVTVALKFHAHQDSPRKMVFGLNVGNSVWGAELDAGQISGLLDRAPLLNISSACRGWGHLPQSASDALLRAGISVDGLGRATLAGNFSARLPGLSGSTSQDWHVDFSEGRVVLERGALRLTEAGIAIDDLSAAIPISASAGPTGVDLVLRDGANIAANELESRWSGPERLRPNDSKVDLADLTLLGQDAHLVASWGKGGLVWQGHVPALRLRLAPTDIDLPDGSHVSAVAGIVQVSADANAKGTSVALTDGSWLGFQGAHVPRGGAPLEVGPLYLQSASLKRDKSANLLISPGSDLGAHMHFASAWKNPFNVKAGADAAELNDIAFDATLARKHGQKPAIAAAVSFDHGSISAAPGIAFMDVSARLPISMNAPADSGNFAAKQVKFAHDTWPGLSGTMKIADGKLDFSAKWPLLKEAALSAEGWVDSKGLGGTPRADLHLSIPKFKLSDPEELASLTSAVKDLQLTGGFAADARITLDRDQITPKITFTVDGANLQSKQNTANIQNISTAIEIDSFQPFSTPGNQHITIGHATVGKLDVSGGDFTFSVESPRSVLVEKSEWGWAGGQLYTDAFRIDPRHPAVDLVAYADRLSIPEILKLAAGPDAGGAGAVYGRLPLKVNWPNIEFGDGFLYAAPGPGDLQLGATASTKVDQLLSQNPRFSAGPDGVLVRSRIVASLRRFHYDVLKMDFTRHGDSLTASIKLDGYGQIGTDKQELHLEVNANGFDKLLKDALVIKSLLGK